MGMSAVADVLHGGPGRALEEAENEIISGEQQRVEVGDAIAARGRSHGALRDYLEVGLGDAGPVALGRIQHAAKPHPSGVSRMLQAASALGASQHRPVWGTLEGGGVDTRLEFGILGPLEVRLDGTPVRVGGPRQRALLALLLCNANRVVSRDQLIDELLSGPAGGFGGPDAPGSDLSPAQGARRR